jgi:hypothetical protein
MTARSVNRELTVLKIDRGARRTRWRRGTKVENPDYAAFAACVIRAQARRGVPAAISAGQRPVTRQRALRVQQSKGHQKLHEAELVSLTRPAEGPQLVYEFRTGGRSNGSSID